MLVKRLRLFVCASVCVCVVVALFVWVFSAWVCEWESRVRM